jgi:hypothetical protein
MTNVWYIDPDIINPELDEQWNINSSEVVWTLHISYIKNFYHFS